MLSLRPPSRATSHPRTRPTTRERGQPAPRTRPASPENAASRPGELEHAARGLRLRHRPGGAGGMLRAALLRPAAVVGQHVQDVRDPARIRDADVRRGPARTDLDPDVTVDQYAEGVFISDV